MFSFESGFSGSLFPYRRFAMMFYVKTFPRADFTAFILLASFIAACLCGPMVSSAAETDLAAENFESFSGGDSILSAEQWKGFEGLREKPSAVVKEGVGVDQSKALALSHVEPLRADNYGVRLQLPEPMSDGAVWVQCQIKSPEQWKSGVVFDLRGSKSSEVIARIAAGPYTPKGSETTRLRWHSVFTRAYWRLYTDAPMESRWRKLTARVDFATRTYACWVDEQSLGDELPLTSGAALSQIYIGGVGDPDEPMLLDELVVTRVAPEGFRVPKLLPDPADDLIFRFAATGDPQLGFTGIDTDKARFAHAVEQINRSGAEHSLMLGDMVHNKNDLDAYVSMQELVKGFAKPYHYVRGNHEVPELFLRYFYRDLHYSVVHKGLRFVIIDAEGNHVGMSDEQLDWIESEFKAAEKAGEEIVIALHVSPWEKNERGRGKYNQIGAGRERLRELMKKHSALLSLSGHYHRGLWHGHEEKTHYLTLGGTALVKGGCVGWCVFDVYPDRIVIHQKPLFFAYETADVQRVHTANGWLDYRQLKAQHPYAQQGPLTIERHRPIK